MEYIVKVSCLRTQENGKEKNVKELNIVSGDSFSNVEEKIVKEYDETTSDEYGIEFIKVSPYKEIKDGDLDLWFNVKIAFITVNDIGKEKVDKYSYLFNASDIDDARSKTKEFMKDSMSDYEIISINKTDIIEWIK